jgi:hypothetical protein
VATLTDMYPIRNTCSDSRAATRPELQLWLRACVVRLAFEHIRKRFARKLVLRNGEWTFGGHRHRREFFYAGLFGLTLRADRSW